MYSKQVRKYMRSAGNWVWASSRSHPFLSLPYLWLVLLLFVKFVKFDKSDFKNKLRCSCLDGLTACSDWLPSGLTGDQTFVTLEIERKV